MNTIEEILHTIIIRLARITLWRMRPMIVGITGSTGKTTAGEATTAVLKSAYIVRQSKAGIESTWSIPLAILGSWGERDYSAIRTLQEKGLSGASLVTLVKVILQGGMRAIVGGPGAYPRILVLEYGMGRKSNIKELLEIARPHIGVITTIGEVPPHVERFTSPEALMREKAKIVEGLSVQGWAILNFDNEGAIQCKNRTRAKIMTFGYAEGADLRIAHFDHRYENEMVTGVSFKLEYDGNAVPLTLTGVIGKAQGYAAAIGVCVGVVTNINLVKAASALEAYYRARNINAITKGMNESYIINESEQASPLSVEEALHNLRDLPGDRKIAVLGDMLELGKYAVEAHEDIGRITSKVVDILVTVGPRAKYIAEAAKKKGLAKEKIISCDTSHEATSAVQALLRKGDLVLIKASRAMGLGEVAEQIKGVGDAT